jgi:UDP-N-acetylmuramate dehydrogenase
MRDVKRQSSAGHGRQASRGEHWVDLSPRVKTPDTASGGRVSVSTRSLRRIVGEAFRLDEPMSRHTTIGVGGIARVLVVPRNMKQVVELVRYARSAGLDYVVVGKGSNLIVRDSGYDGIVLKMGTHLSKIRMNRRTVFAEGGASFARLARNITRQGRTGMEFGVGIPGTVGGAVVMNAGAFGGEVADIITRVKLVDADGIERVYRADEIEFEYRKTSIPSGSVVLSATFNCPPGRIDNETYRRSLRRKETQPISERTFGSTFVNPPRDYAARMIEACGLKGVRRGGAMVSPMHANFIVNVDGKATAGDVEGLIRLMRREVKKKFGVTLKTEVIVIGNR